MARINNTERTPLLSPPVVNIESSVPPFTQKTKNFVERFWTELRRLASPGTAILEVNFVNGDVNSAEATGKSVYNTITHHTPDPTTPGISTAISVNAFFMSFLNFIRGIVISEEGHKNQDGTRLFAGVARMFRGAGEFFNSSSNITASGINAAGKVKSFQNAVAALNLVSLVGVSTVSIAIGSTCVSYAKEIHHMHTGFNKALENDNVKGLSFLKDSLIVTEGDRAKLTETIAKDEKPWYRKSFGPLLQKFFGNETTLYATQAKDLIQQLKLATSNPDYPNRVTESEKLIKGFSGNIAGLTITSEATNMADELLLALNKENVITNTNLDDGHSDKWKNKLKGILQNLCQIELDTLQAKKEAVFGRVFGEDIKNNVKTLTVDTNGQVTRTAGEEVTAVSAAHVQTIIADAKKASNRNLFINYIIIVGCFLGAAAGIISEIVASPVVDVLEMVVAVVTALIWLGVDGYCLYQAYATQEHTKTDKVFMVLNTLVITLSNLLAVILLKVGSKALKIALPAVFVGMWLVTMLYGIYKAKDKKVEDPIKLTSPVASADSSGYGSHTEAEAAAS